MTGLGALNMLDSYRRRAYYARFYQASSSGDVRQPTGSAIRKTTPFCARQSLRLRPRCSGAATWQVSYREAYGLHIKLRNPVQPREPAAGRELGHARKITLGLARIKAGLCRTKLVLGNLSARRGLGLPAPEYVEAMWMMLQRDYAG